MSESKRIFLAMPSGGGHPHMAATKAFWTATRGRDQVVRMAFASSILGKSFNHLWASALSTPGVTHFAMLHDDIAPTDLWLDTLIEQLEASQADLISAIVPIKDDRGVTSTGVGRPDDIFDFRRLTTTEVQTLPETFGLDDLPETITAGGRDCLLVNTGCWVCDLRRPWWRTVDARGHLKFHFTIRDRVTRRDDGRYVAEFAPEDWTFSRMCHAVGAKVRATKVVHATHFGGRAYSADDVWGEAIDTEAISFHAQKPGKLAVAST